MSTVSTWTRIASVSSPNLQMFIYRLVNAVFKVPLNKRLVIFFVFKGGRGACPWGGGTLRTRWCLTLQVRPEPNVVGNLASIRPRPSAPSDSGRAKELLQATRASCSTTFDKANIVCTCTHTIMLYPGSYRSPGKQSDDVPSFAKTFGVACIPQATDSRAGHATPAVPSPTILA